MDVRNVEIWGWDGLSLASGRVSIAVAPKVGGRIVSLKLDEVETFFTLPQLRGRSFDVAAAKDVRGRKIELGWLHYGGYKTWLAPQDRWTDELPYLDLDSGSYRVDVAKGSEESSVRMTSPVCRETGMELMRTVSLSRDGSIAVQQTMRNRSSEDATWGLWDVTQVQGPGVALLPVAHRSRFTNGVKAYANEGRSVEMMHEYVNVSEGLASIKCHQAERFKYGTDSLEGWIGGLLDRSNERWLAYLKLFRPVANALYPHESVVEVYDCGTNPYFELEVHSPLQTLAPGESYSYSEDWRLEWFPKSADLNDVQKWVTNTIRGNS